MEGNSELEVSVLKEWKSIVAVYKPPCLSTTKDSNKETSLVEILQKKLKLTNPPHAASRLDFDVSGVVLCSVNRQGHEQMDELNKKGKIVKTYVAIVNGNINSEYVLDFPIGQKRDSRRFWAPCIGGTNPKNALTKIKPMEKTKHSQTLVQCELVTGRMHQIRLHTSHSGFPILGDARYGGEKRIIDSRGQVFQLSRVMLHSYQLKIFFEKGDSVEVVSKIPPSMQFIWDKL